jgi:folate-binding protein YgfZ
MEAGGDEIRPVGARALETLRIEAGVPRFGVETHDKIIPLEANLGELISFEKGCYVGQEIIARLDTRGTPAKRLRTLVFQGGAAPHEGAELEADGRNAGEVVSATWSPLLEQPIALAYVKRNVNDPGTEVDVEGRTARVELAGYPLDEQSDRAEGAA